MPLQAFHPAIQSWFSARFDGPTAAQLAGWPQIRAGEHTLIAAPTGSGKTLAAFLLEIDRLLREGPALRDTTRVLYISPLRALARDVQKNLERPLEEIRKLDPSLPEVRVLVRTGDTPAKARAQMTRRPPHILVTTPESLYILLTSAGGRDILRGIRTVIVDEIHALYRDKRGTHLALSLERLEALAGREHSIQRIGLSATQKPIENVAQFLVGTGRRATIVDTGHLREIDLAIEVPPSPLSAVCSHEQWEEIYARIADLVREHRTTLVFVNTRKFAERIAARLEERLGRERVGCHHGSLSAERRLAAEQKLKNGDLAVLVATASLELGIDIGEVDLVIQVGSSRSIATLLQRVGRAGHGVGRVPKGRLFPLTLDELVEASAVVLAIQRGILDRTPEPRPALDILAQQMVAACVNDTWTETELYQLFRGAWPFRDLDQTEFDRALSLHAQGRTALLHRDAVGGRVRATRRARLTAITSGGAIPDNADYRVILEPEGTFLGTLNEDFAIESNRGDIFQLGTASWQILRVEPGTVRVSDAKGAPPTIPFWLGEAPARTQEVSRIISEIRSEHPDSFSLERELGVPVSQQITEYFARGKSTLGVIPSQDRVVLERFFDETEGMQLILHAPFGSRINRAWGLALRKRFCRSFGFELQAAANDEAILLSLGPMHSFPLEEVFDYLHPDTARDILLQALIPTPLFKVRFRWNATRSLVLERMRKGKTTPAALLRMRADDLLASCFPEALACGETLPQGDLPIPMDHPLVRQTVDDCLNEAMDVDGFLEVLRALRAGKIGKVALDTAAPSSFAEGILAAQPYSFLDDAPLEERRTQAVMTRRWGVESRGELGVLDPDAIRRVREEAWPDPTSAEEVHEALLWMGYVTVSEAEPWRPWLAELEAAQRVVREGGRIFAVEAPRDPKEVMRGRLEALGPIVSNDPVLLELEREGAVLRGRFEGQKEGWCNRRLLARIQRYTVDRLRKEIEPVTARDFVRFLAAWQHLAEGHKLEGPAGVLAVIQKLAGFEVPALAWESTVLPARVQGYQRAFLDELTLSGEVAWGRLWGKGLVALRSTPICLLPREELDSWLGLAQPADTTLLSADAQMVHTTLTQRGAMFTQELARVTRLLPTQLETAIAELIARGALTGDSVGTLRILLLPEARRRRRAGLAPGRLTLFRNDTLPAPGTEFLAQQLLRRTGVVFRRLLLREKMPVLWRDLVRVYRSLEMRGEVRGGRFVAGFDGEQYALPQAIPLLRAQRGGAPGNKLEVSAADPLNYRGILTPDERVSSYWHRRVEVA